MKRPPGAPDSVIHQAIVPIRGRRVMLDADLATLYGVPTRALVQAVQRNVARSTTPAFGLSGPGQVLARG